MKILKINDSILINVEQVYSLEKHSNQKELDQWDLEYNSILEGYYKDPPELMLKGGLWYKPDFENTKEDKHIEEYISEVNNKIIFDIGSRPQYVETYKLILTTGLKITIDKEIYDKLYEYFIKFMI